MSRHRARVGLLFRGDRSVGMAGRSLVLTPLLDALDGIGVAAEPVVFADAAVDDVREQLLGLDGVLVWVNPIQDGATRVQLDALLDEMCARGLFVSAHPDVVRAIGTKEILYRSRDIGWGTDTDLYDSVVDFEARFPKRLAETGVRVVKQARGNGGNGVWKVELLAATGAPDAATRVRVQHAHTKDATTEELELGEFMRRCGTYFAWSGVLVDQPFNPRLADGLVRCYLTHDRVVGFCHQHPKGLLDAAAISRVTAEQAAPPMEPPDAPAYGRLRRLVEEQWVPELCALVGLAATALPVIWDVDLLYGPKDHSGEDTHVLCEINVSAVWPFPPYAIAPIAAATAARLRDARTA